MLSPPWVPTCNHRSNHPRFMVIDTLVIVLSFLGGQALDVSLLNGTDDDDMDGGMMIPIYQGSR